MHLPAVCEKTEIYIFLVLFWKGMWVPQPWQLFKTWDTFSNMWSFKAFFFLLLGNLIKSWVVCLSDEKKGEQWFIYETLSMCFSRDPEKDDENMSSIPALSSIFRDSLPALFLWLRGKICNGCPGLSICLWTGAMSVSRSNTHYTLHTHTHCLSGLREIWMGEW